MADTISYYRNRVHRWIDGVLDGSISAGLLVQSAAQRHIDDLEHGEERGLIFDEAIAARSCKFFRLLRHTTAEWQGRPFELSPSQLFITWSLFGWRTVGRFRRFREAYITVGRKWGKTTWAAGIANLLLFADFPREPDCWGYCAATKADQARLVHTPAVRFALNTPELAQFCTAFRWRNDFAALVLKGPYAGSFFKPLGQDSGTSGLNPAFVIIDELHEWRKLHEQLHATLTTAGGSRRHPLTLYITTSGDERSELWKTIDASAIRMLEAVATREVIDDTLFAFVARLDEERPCECYQEPECEHCKGTGIIPADDPYDPANWPKANPEIGLTPKRSYVEAWAQKAKRSPELERDFLRYICNVRIRRARKATTRELWMRCKAKLSDWSESIVYGGIDIGTLDDLASIAACAKFPIGFGADGNTLYRHEVRAKAYIPEECERDLESEPFKSWIQNGWLEKHEGRSIQLGAIEADIVDWSERYGVVEWAFDPSQAMYLAQRLISEHDVFAGQFPQTYRQYNEILRALTRKMIPNKDIAHDGNLVLAWAVQNLALKANYRGELMPDKDASEDKIDPAVAMIMALKLSYLSVDEEAHAFAAGDSIDL